MNIIIKATNFNIVDEQREFVEEKFNSLSRFHNRIIEIRTEVGYEHLHKGGDTWRCEANVSIPGKLIRVEKNTNDFEKSVNKVKDHLKVVLSKERKKSITKSRR